MAIFAMMGCTKQTKLTPTGAASGGTMLTTKTVKQHNDKDGEDTTALDSMARAANIKYIDYDEAHNNYTVKTYTNSITYTVEIINSYGALVLKKDVQSVKGVNNIKIHPNLSGGIYQVRLSGNNIDLSRKLVIR